jgi:phosphoglycerate kinase
MKIQIGNSLFDKVGSEKVAGLLEKAKAKNIKVVFPVDYVTADKFDKDANVSSSISLELIMADGGEGWRCHRCRGYSRWLAGSRCGPQNP